jgi:hypothetical protein
MGCCFAARAGSDGINRCDIQQPPKVTADERNLGLPCTGQLRIDGFDPAPARRDGVVFANRLTSAQRSGSFRAVRRWPGEKSENFF